MTGHCIERAPITDLLAWAEKNKLAQIIAYRPEIGVLNDQLAEIEKALEKANVRLVLLSRGEDDEFQSLATAGFFGFWKKIESRIRALR